MPKKNVIKSNEYQEFYDETARVFLESIRSEKALAGALHTTPLFIEAWKEEYPSFAKAIEEGLARGLCRLEEKMAECSFNKQSPGQIDDVTSVFFNYMISNVYGGKTKSPTVIVGLDGANLDKLEQVLDKL